MIVAILLSAISTSQGFFITPQFEIKAMDDLNNSTKLTMKNIGWVQAKNVHAFIDNDNALKLISDNCYEGKLIPSEKVQIKIDFLKMSSSIECNLFFEGKIRNQMSVIMVADETTGKSWTFKDQQDKTIFYAFTILPIFTIGAITASAISTILLFYSIFQSRRKQENYTKREDDLVEERKVLQLEIRTLQSKQGSGRSPKKHAEDNQKIENLKESLKEISSEIDEVRVKMLTETSPHKLVGVFFNNWAVLEIELARIGEEFKFGSVMLRYNVSIISKKLFEIEKIDAATLNKFRETNRFRNQVAHGMIFPSNNELKEHMKSIKELILVFKKINKI